MTHESDSDRQGLLSVRATLPPSMLFADNVLPCKEYIISMPKA